MFQILAVVLVVGTSAWVLIDSGHLGAHRGALGGGLLDMGQVGWFVCCLLLWIVAFPAYLVARPRLIQARSARAALWSANFGGPGHAATPAVSNRVAGTAGVAAIVAVVGLLGAQIAQDDPGRPVAGAPAPTPVAVQHTTAAEPSLAAQLQSIALRSSDFHAGYRVALVPHGDEVSGQVTLDNCGHRFVTESARVARHQVEVRDPRGRAVVSDEVVAYRDSRQAGAALVEWYRAAAHCPHHAFRTTIAGMPRLRVHVSVNRPHMSAVPSSDNVFTAESIKPVAEHVHTVYGVMLIQVHGRILDAISAVQPSAPTQRDIVALEEFATLSGARLMRT